MVFLTLEGQRCGVMVVRFPRIMIVRSRSRDHVPRSFGLFWADETRRGLSDPSRV